MEISSSETELSFLGVYLVFRPNCFQISIDNRLSYGSSGPALIRKF